MFRSLALRRIPVHPQGYLYCCEDRCLFRVGHSGGPVIHEGSPSVSAPFDDDISCTFRTMATSLRRWALPALPMSAKGESGPPMGLG